MAHYTTPMIANRSCSAGRELSDLWDVLVVQLLRTMKKWTLSWPLVARRLLGDATRTEMSRNVPTDVPFRHEGFAEIGSSQSTQNLVVLMVCRQGKQQWRVRHDYLEKELGIDLRNSVLSDLPTRDWTLFLRSITGTSLRLCVAHTPTDYKKKRKGKIEVLFFLGHRKNSPPV